MGAVDVIPFVPIGDATMDEAVSLSNDVGRDIWRSFRVPVFLYEESAADPLRKNLPDIRRGEFEGLAEKMKQPMWKPDFGEAVPHPSAGAVVVGARMPLIAFNVNLDTSSMPIASAIARAVRHQSEGCAIAGRSRLISNSGHSPGFNEYDELPGNPPLPGPGDGKDGGRPVRSQRHRQRNSRPRPDRCPGPERGVLHGPRKFFYQSDT